MLYRTRALSPRIDGDLAVIASPSAARVLAEINPAIPVVSIGPETTRGRAGGRPARRSARRESPDVAGLVRAVRGVASGRGHHVPVRLRARRRLRRCLPRRDRADRARGAGDRHHARDRAAGRAPGRARAREHAAVHARGRPPRGRRPGRRQRPPGGRRPRPRGPRLRRPGQRPARPGGGALRGSRAPGSSRTPPTGWSGCHGPFTAATSSRRRRRTSRRASTPEELGPALEPASLVRLELPEAEIGDGRDPRDRAPTSTGSGTSQLNLSPADLERAGIVPGEPEVELGVAATTRPWRARSRTPGRASIILYEDAYENIALAITGGNAAEMLAIRAGDELTIAST